MNKKIIIFGQGLYTEIINQYLTDDSEYEVVAFTLDDDYIKLWWDRPYKYSKYKVLPLKRFKEQLNKQK